MRNVLLFCIALLCGCEQDFWCFLEPSYCFGTDDESLLDEDEDGLTLRKERELGTDPESPDTDGDGANDGEEVDCGTDPLDGASVCAPDTDGDGRRDDEEAARGTDPENPDTDGDGFSDGEEHDCDSSPLDPQLTCEDN